VTSTQGTYLNVQNVLVDFFCFGELPRFLLDYRDVQPREESVAIVGAKSSTHDLCSGAIKSFRFIVLLFLLENDAEVFYRGERILVLWQSIPAATASRVASVRARPFCTRMTPPTSAPSFGILCRRPIAVTPQETP
jgi:hypothetical protein